MQWVYEFAWGISKGRLKKINLVISGLPSFNVFQMRNSKTKDDLIQLFLIILYVRVLKLTVTAVFI